MKPLETGWKSFLYKDIKHVSCYNEFSLGRAAIMATVQFAHEVYHSQVSSNNSLSVLDCSIPTTVEGCSSQYEAGYWRSAVQRVSLFLDKQPAIQGIPIPVIMVCHIYRGSPYTPGKTTSHTKGPRFYQGIQENHMTPVYRKSILEIWGYIYKW